MNIIIAQVPVLNAPEDDQSEECNNFPLESINTANGIFEVVVFYHPDIESGLNTKHWLMAYGLWLMEANLRDEF